MKRDSVALCCNNTLNRYDDVLRWIHIPEWYTEMMAWDATIYHGHTSLRKIGRTWACAEILTCLSFWVEGISNEGPSLLVQVREEHVILAVSCLCSMMIAHHAIATGDRSMSVIAFRQWHRISNQFTFRGIQTLYLDHQAVNQAGKLSSSTHPSTLSTYSFDCSEACTPGCLCYIQCDFCCVVITFISTH